jgi:hypothetical protein
MSRYGLIAVCVLAGMLGCRCCPCLDHYGDVMDCVTDVDIAFDAWYCPRCDKSRAGKPDWCGSLHQWMCPCRCQQGCWDRYDECWLYPPSYPYHYPAQALYDIGRSAQPAADERLPDVPTYDLMSPDSPEAPGGALPPAPPPNGSSPPPPPVPEGWRPRRSFELR